MRQMYMYTVEIPIPILTVEIPIPIWTFEIPIPIWTFEMLIPTLTYCWNANTNLIVAMRWFLESWNEDTKF